MKTLLKLFIIILILGVIAVVGGFSVIGFDIDKLDALYLSDSDFTLVEESFDELAENIVTDLQNNQIVVTRSNDEKTYISYYTNDEYNIISHSFEDKTLSIVGEKKDWKSIFFLRPMISLSEKPFTLNIALPKEYNKSLTLKTSNGVVKISEQTLEKIDIKSSNGVIKLENVKADEVRIETTNGAIKVSDSHITDTLNVKTSNGVINVDNVEAAKVVLRTSNGEIETNSLFSDDIEAVTSNGRIALEVKGSLNEYSIEYSTSNGTCHVGGSKHDKSGHINKGAGKRIYAKTSNGAIKIEFNH